MCEQLRAVAVETYSKGGDDNAELGVDIVFGTHPRPCCRWGAGRAQTEAAPSQTTVQKPDGSVQQSGDRSEGTVTIDREWKAHGGNDRTGSVGSEEGHETIGRDWRAHPDK